MGQTTVGVMLGVKADARARRLVDAYVREGHAGCPGDECGKVLGFWIAVRNGDSDGVAGIEAPFALDEIATAKPTAKAYARAAKQWEAFAAWCAARGKPLPASRLWLTTTEVA